MNPQFYSVSFRNTFKLGPCENYNVGKCGTTHTQIEDHEGERYPKFAVIEVQKAVPKSAFQCYSSNLAKFTSSKA